MNCCDVCGFPVEYSYCVLSDHTGKYYCLDMDECGRRAREELTLDEVCVLAKMAIECLR